MDWIEEYIKEELERKETKEIFESEKDLKRVYANRLLRYNEFWDMANSLYKIIEPNRVPKRKEWQNLYSLQPSEIPAGSFDGFEWFIDNFYYPLYWIAKERLQYFFESMSFKKFEYSTDESRMYMSVSETDSKEFYERVNEKFLYYCSKFPVKVKGYLWFDHEGEYAHAANKNKKCLNCAYIYNNKGQVLGKLKAIHLWDMFLIGIPKEPPKQFNKPIDVKNIQFEDTSLPFTNRTLFLPKK